MSLEMKTLHVLSGQGGYLMFLQVCIVSRIAMHSRPEVISRRRCMYSIFITRKTYERNVSQKRRARDYAFFVKMLHVNHTYYKVNKRDLYIIILSGFFSTVIYLCVF